MNTICLMNFLREINGVYQLICRKPHHCLSILSKTRFISSSTPNSNDDLVSTAVSILKHHRSKTRWSHLRSLLTTSRNKTLTPSQFSEIALQIRNNAHLTLSFFNFTLQHSLCSHSLFSYSTVIHILSRARLKYEALTLIKSAMCAFSPDNQQNTATPGSILEALIKSYRACDSAPFVFDLLVKACLESKKIDLAIEIYEKLKSKNVLLRTNTCNALIELVSKSRGAFAGYDLYRKIYHLDVDCVNMNRKGHKSVTASSHTFNVVMVGFYREGLLDKVEEVWKEMQRAGCVPNLYSFNVLMAAYCDNGRIEESIRVFLEIETKGLKRDAVTYNTIIGGFCGVGEVEKAEEIYRKMVTEGVEGTCITFEHLINGYCENGNVNSAMLLYKDMCRKSFSPGSKTINIIIRTLCDKKEISEALEFWRMAIKKYEAVLEEENYVSLIRGLCQEGKMEEGLKVQEEMVRNGFESNLEVYNAFIDGYMKQGNDAMSGKLRRELLRKKIS